MNWRNIQTIPPQDGALVYRIRWKNDLKSTYFLGYCNPWSEGQIYTLNGFNGKCEFVTSDNLKDFILDNDLTCFEYLQLEDII